MMNLKKKLNNQKGYIALIAILIIVAVTLAVGISMSLLSVGQTQASFTEQQSRQSFQLADGCLEDAISKIKRYDYIGSYYLNLKEGSCNITVEAQRISCDLTQYPAPKPSKDYRIIQITSDVNNIIRNLLAEVYLTGNNATLNCWKEIENNYAI